MLRFIRHLLAQARERCRQPGGRITLLALAGALLSSYPVVFLGQSFVSPYYGTPLLYEGRPALPGPGPSTSRHVAGADVGALMWQHVPYATIQHRALLDEGTWPVWNRYNSGGVPLLGQGQSMFGDPLHWPVILANSAAWAWDLKFLAAKFLLALSLGRLVWELTRHLPAGLITAGVAPFAGLFGYYVNHPAIFGFCYSAGVLYCWWRVAQASPGRAVWGWLGALTVAELALFHSGTVKDAVLLLGGVTTTGILLVLVAEHPWRERWRRLAGSAAAGGVFVLLAAPTWGAFLATLRTAYTSSDGGGVLQVSPTLLLGALEEVFFRPANSARTVYNPSANFVVLAGGLYLMAAVIGSVRPGRSVWALAAGTLGPLALVFGIVPEEWVMRLPLLNRVVHVDDIGLSLVILHWTVLAGVGFAAAGRRLGRPEGARDLGLASVGLAGLLALYLVGGRVPDRAASSAAGHLVEGARVSLGGFVGGYLVVLLLGLLLLGWLARRALRRGRTTGWERAGLVFSGILLLWRPALHAERWFGTYAVRAGPRMDFHASSPAVDWLRAQAADETPERVIGLGRLLFPGWTAVYSLEGIGGPDALMHPGYRALMRASPLRREWDWRYEVTADNVAAARAYLDLLNVRYYAAKAPDERMVGAGLVLRQRADLVIYESPTAWPRAFFCGAVERIDTAEALVLRAGTAAGRPFAAVTSEALAAEPKLAALLRMGEGAAGRVTRFALFENATRLDLESSGPGVCVLTETWWPGMSRVRLNGGDAHVIAINGAFHGVLIPAAGRHEIWVDYQPPHFGVWRAAAGAGVVLLAVGVWLVCRRGRSPVSVQRS